MTQDEAGCAARSHGRRTLGPGTAAATDLDLSFAHWIGTLKDAKTTSNDDDTEEVDLDAVDLFFTQHWP